MVGDSQKIVFARGMVELSNREANLGPKSQSAYIKLRDNKLIKEFGSKDMLVLSTPKCLYFIPFSVDNFTMNIKIFMNKKICFTNSSSLSSSKNSQKETIEPQEAPKNEIGCLRIIGNGLIERKVRFSQNGVNYAKDYVLLDIRSHGDLILKSSKSLDTTHLFKTHPGSRETQISVLEGKVAINYFHAQWSLTAAGKEALDEPVEISFSILSTNNAPSSAKLTISTQSKSELKLPKKPIHLLANTTKTLTLIKDKDWIGSFPEIRLGNTSKSNSLAIKMNLVMSTFRRDKQNPELEKMILEPNISLYWPGERGFLLFVNKNKKKCFC